jgi:general L-amino acid transport system substrate-binding protein
MKLRRLAVVAAALKALAAPAAAGTLDDVKARGVLACGVNGELTGFSEHDTRGNWRGFDVDYCRAYAAAIFNDAGKVKFVKLTAADRLAALQAGAIDVLVRNTTWSIARENQFGVLATGTTYFDGQGFLVRKGLKINTASQLKGRPICVERGTTSESNVADYFGATGVGIQTFTDRDAALKAYDAEQCAAFTSDASTLYGARLKLRKFDDHIVLSDLISREPLSPYVRKGDDEWFDIIRWAHFAMLDAETLDLTQTNLDQFLGSDDRAIKRLLGNDADSGEPMGLPRDWAYRIVKLVGNYGEVFDQNLGLKSPLQMSRGLNALWTRGGIQYAPELR